MRVIVATNVTPAFTIDTNASGSSFLAELLQPTARVEGVATVAPYGEAVDGLGAFVALGVGALAVYGLYQFVRRSR